VVNPYEVSLSSSFKDKGSEVDAQALQIMRLPGMAMAIQGWILTALYSLGLLVIVVQDFEFGERQVLFEMGIPFVIALLMSIQLARCGMSAMRCESRPKAYAGAVLSALLFLPLGILICIWVVRSLNRKEVLEASRTTPKESIDAG
jgi:uncharacterized membrane protein YqjE